MQLHHDRIGEVLMKMHGESAHSPPRYGHKLNSHGSFCDVRLRLDY